MNVLTELTNMITKAYDKLVTYKGGSMFLDGKQVKTRNELETYIKDINGYNTAKGLGLPEYDIYSVSSLFQELEYCANAANNELLDARVFSALTEKFGEFTTNKYGTPNVYLNGGLMEAGTAKLLSLEYSKLKGRPFEPSEKESVNFIICQCIASGLYLEDIRTEWSEMPGGSETAEQFHEAYLKLARIFYRAFGLKKWQADQAKAAALAMIYKHAASLCPAKDYNDYNPQSFVAIVGRAGIGKTTFFERLYDTVSIGWNRWAYDGESNESREAIKLGGKRAIIVDDFFLNNGSMASLKAFVCRRELITRVPMGATDTAIINNCMVVFTSNERELMQEEAGIDRRLIVIESPLAELQHGNVTNDEIDEARNLIIFAGKAAVTNRIIYRESPIKDIKLDNSRYIVKRPMEDPNILKTHILSARAVAYDEEGNEHIVTITGTFEALYNNAAVLERDKLYKQLPTAWDLINSRKAIRALKGISPFDDAPGFPFEPPTDETDAYMASLGFERTDGIVNPFLKKADASEPETPEEFKVFGAPAPGQDAAMMQKILQQYCVITKETPEHLRPSWKDYVASLGYTYFE